MGCQFNLAVMYRDGRGSAASPAEAYFWFSLADSPEIFISYRRADARLQAELADAFGAKRVFSDVTHIHAGEVWRASVEAVLEQAKVGIVVAGNQWLTADPVLTAVPPRDIMPEFAEVRP